MALSIIFRYLLLNKTIILIFLSFSSYIESSSVIGNFPTSKRLNNGYYFVISTKNVVIADSTFTSIIEKYTFTSSLYGTLTDTYSTTIAQFPKEDNGYIIAIIKRDLYIFENNGDYLYNIPVVSFVITSEFYNIIPFGKSGNTYNFYIVYGKELIEGNYFTAINFSKFYYNDISKTISMQDTISYSTTLNGNIFRFYEFFSCKLMNYNNKRVINCIYGDSLNFITTVFEVNLNMILLIIH